MKWTNFVAWRYFNSSKKDKLVNLASKISVVTSTFAVAFLIVSFSIFKGYEKALIQKLTKGSGHIIIESNKAFDPSEIKENLKNFNMENVVESSGLIASGLTCKPVYLYGSSFNKLKRIESNDIPIAISQNLAQEMGYRTSDIISIIVPVTAPAPFFILPESIMCEIVKIQKFDSEELNENGIKMNIEDLQKILDIGTNIHKIKLFFSDIKHIEAHFNHLKQSIKNKKILHWKEYNDFFLKIMKSEQNVFFILLGLLIILCCLLYVLSIGMFINSKKEDIKIFKVLGAKNNDILNIFWKYSMIISFFNMLFGTILGLFISFNINNIIKFIEKTLRINLFPSEAYLINYIPVSIEPMYLINLLIFYVLISSISSFLISKKINSIDVFKNL